MTHTPRRSRRRVNLPTVLIAALASTGGLSLPACVPVAPYQRAYLNDEDMQLAQQKHQTFESNFEVYREGASGANGGKIGGGCGCN